MSDNYGAESEEFEKVEALAADQDENVTSSSLTGDMAEEDRYDSSSAAQNEVDLLGDFMSSGGNVLSEPVAEEPLMSFDRFESGVQDVHSSVAESITPEKYTSGEDSAADCSSKGKYKVLIIKQSALSDSF